MKKSSSLLVLVLMISVNVLTPFSYAQENGSLINQTIVDEQSDEDTFSTLSSTGIDLLILQNRPSKIGDDEVIQYSKNSLQDNNRGDEQEYFEQSSQNNKGNTVEFEQEDVNNEKDKKEASIEGNIQEIGEVSPKLAVDIIPEMIEEYGKTENQEESEILGEVVKESELKRGEVGNKTIKSMRGEFSIDTAVVDSVDGGKITIMEEDVGILENSGWNERDQGPCPEGYHVPTIQDWNTLFVSWCENHTKLNDGICDVRNLDRDVWEENMKDFIYKPKDKKVLDFFSEELNLKRGFEVVEICDEEYGYCDYEPQPGYPNRMMYDDSGFYMDFAYRTSNPYRVGDGYPMSWSYMLSSYYTAINRPKLNKWKLNVRCFSDEYLAPDRMVLVDIIDKNKLEEYKQIEEKFRLGEEELPDDKQMEIALTQLFLSSQSREAIKVQLRLILIPSLDEKYNCERCSGMSAEEKQHYIDLQNLVESVVSSDEGDDNSELIDRVNNFEWLDSDYYTDFGLGCEDVDYCDEKYYIKSYLLFVLGEIDTIPGLSESDLIQEIEDVKQKFYRWIDSDYDFFSEEEKQNLKRHINDLENYDAISTIDMLKSVNQEIYDLLVEKYPEEFDKLSVYDKLYFGWFSWLLDVFKIAAEFTDANKLIGEEFINESKIYLGTDNWIRGDGTIDVKEMVLQEYLQDIFSQMGYRVVVTPDMTAKQIREKFANIKGISLEDDEYLALFDVNGNEINIDGGIKQNSRGYVEIKKIKKEEGKGRSGGGGRGGGGSSKKSDEDTHGSAEDSQQNNTQDDKNIENVIQNETKGSEESSNTPMDYSDKSSEGQEILSPSDSSFTKEQKDAYTFAKENGITNKNTIQSAQMNAKLTRIAMAKMLSQYAINVLGQTPDISKTIKFKDVTSKKDLEYDNGVTLAYQLGIMGQNMKDNEFRPDDEVSRAEFVTALSRLLYDTSDGEYKSTSKYYTYHMEKLVSEGIMIKADPSMKEKRGYVMIMLMRSAK